MSPAVAGNVVYLGSCSGLYYAFDIHSGSIVWSYDFKAKVGQATFHGDPLLVDNLLITGSEALMPPQAWAFDLKTGRLVWDNEGDRAFTLSDVIGVGNRAIGRNDDGELIAIDAKTGELAWRVTHEGRRFPVDVAESPAAQGSRVVFTGPDGGVYHVDGAEGSVSWRTQLDCDVSTSTAFVGSDVYVGCRTGDLFRISAGDGRILDSVSLNQPFEGRLLVLDDRIVIPGGRSWIGAVDRNLGQVLWARSNVSPLSVVQPILWGREVVTGTGEGNLLGLDLESGETVWSMQLQGRIRGLGKADDVLLVGTIEGKLFALRPRKW